MNLLQSEMKFELETPNHSDKGFKHFFRKFLESFP